MRQDNRDIYYIHFDCIPSTNSWAKENAPLLDENQITCITALEQTAGRGRNARSWFSPRGLNIYATLYFCLPVDFKWLINLGQIFSLSCATVLQHKGFTPKVKWPNDVLLEGKKVAGILSEVIRLEDRLGIILGIGINVNMSEELLATIDQPATSLAQLSGTVWDMECILKPLIEQFLIDLAVLSKQGFPPFVPLYEHFLAFKGEKIAFQEGGSKTEGICEAISADGRLSVLLPSGKHALYASGDIQLIRSGG